MSRVIDSHQHFWAFDPELYPWIDDDLASLGRDFLPGDLRPILDQQGVEGSVAVQARQDRAETQWLLELASQNPWILGVVGWVDLRADDVATTLDEVADTKLVGVRHVLQDEPPEFMLQPSFLRGLSKLPASGLAYDLLIYPHHLPNALQLCEKNPDLRIVVDHCAKPQIRKGELSPWTDHMRRLGAMEHVWCKVSGLVTEADWNAWTADDFRTYLDVVFESFGPERLMFGSDWPVCTVAGAYEEVLGLARECTSHLSTDRQAAVFGGNAAKFYGL